MTPSPAYTLHPQLPARAAAFGRRFLEDVHACRRRSDRLLPLLRARQADPFLNTLDGPDLLALRLYLEVLEDLARLGWVFDAEGDNLVALPPDAAPSANVEQHEVKARLRAALVEARNEQLREPSVRDFLAEMERTRRWGSARRSVLDLFASPQALAADLAHRLAAPEEVRTDLLRRAVRPYLQQATSDPDEHTGLRLRDIWRYCRYTWSLPYNSQPGRRLHYLVRDAARPGHPVMGIGALGNSMVQITARDEAIGWTLDGLRASEDLGARIAALDAELDRTLAEIYIADFLEDGVLGPDDLTSPTEDTLHRLAEAADEAGRASIGPDGDESDLEAAARSDRYRRKRAVALRSILAARRTFARAEGSTPAERGRTLLASPEGRTALKAALRSAKKRRVGTAMMDLTTCGAVPPYGEVLGGKLIGLLLASPQIVADYARRYAEAESHIASRMAGRPVSRRSDLVLLCTTSLYYVGSSQYNRLRAPTAHGELRYEHVGETVGFGSVHLSGRTYTTLQELLRTHPDLERQSYRFAAGVNYKLRSIAAALGFLGLSALQRHENPRLVYTVPLATNWREYLIGQDDEPDWLYAEPERPASETKDLIEYWTDRWFVPRVQRPETLRRLRSAPPVRRVSDDIKQRTPLFEGATFSNAARPSTRATVTRHMPAKPTVPWTTLAELVGNRASFAEKLEPVEVEALHVSTDLDKGLLSAVRKGHRLYLSGNPGDGKTHIIRRFDSELEGVFVNLDASATDEEELAGKLVGVAERSEPAVVAVNEGPLRKMRSRLSSKDEAALLDQLDRPFVYGDEDDPEWTALLLNLGTRQSLHPDIVSGTIDVVLNRIDYDGAPAAVQRNVDALAQERVQGRLRLLLSLAAQSGEHVTMHQLFGFFSFITTGGRNDEAAETIVPYYDLAFADENPLASAVRALDPAALTHPLIDMRLWDGDSHGADEWLTTPSGDAPHSIENPEVAAARFVSLKRQFFFETRDGDDVLEMLPGDRRSFHLLIQKVQEGNAETAKQDILEALARFFGDHPEQGRADGLPIWTGLRYNALGPPTALVADVGQTIRAEHVELRLPRLRAQAAAFIEYLPDHVRLRLRQHPEAALDIDLELWLQLEAVRRGLPAQYRDPVVSGRIERFLSRAARFTETPTGGVTHLQIRDVETGHTHDVLAGQRTFRL